MDKEREDVLEKAIIMSIANMNFEDDFAVKENNEVVISVKNTIIKAKVLKKEVNNARHLG